MAGLKVVLKDTDQKFQRARKLCIGIGQKHIDTPCRALILKDSTSESRLIKNTPVRGINEIYKKLTKEKIEQIDGDKKQLEEFGKSLRYVFERPEAAKELNLLIFSYENRDPKDKSSTNYLPSQKEIEYLCGIVAHPLTDVVIPPRVAGISGEKYLQFLKAFFENMNSYMTNPPLVGFLPLLARSEFIQLTEFYFNKGISSYVMDFEGRNPLDNYLLVGLAHRLSDKIDKEYKEDTFIHAFNVPFTKIKQKIDATPAKDIMSFVIGFDSYGTSHIPQKMPLHVIEKLKERKASHAHALGYGSSSSTHLGEEPFEIFRIFNRGDYGYYRNDLPNLEQIVADASPTSIQLSNVSDTKLSEHKQRAFRKAFNVERQGLEAVELRQHISENGIPKHLEQKRYARDSLRMISRLSQSSMEDFTPN